MLSYSLFNWLQTDSDNTSREWAGILSRTWYITRRSYRLWFWFFWNISTWLIKFLNTSFTLISTSRGGSRVAATSKMERVVIIVNGIQPLTIITKHSILDVAAALDPPLHQRFSFSFRNVSGIVDSRQKYSSE